MIRPFARVLLVEDNSALRSVHRNALRNAGHLNVIETSMPRDAFFIATTQSIALIVWAMPRDEMFEEILRVTGRSEDRRPLILLLVHYGCVDEHRSCEFITIERPVTSATLRLACDRTTWLEVKGSDRMAMRTANPDAAISPRE